MNRLFATVKNFKIIRIEKCQYNFGVNKFFNFTFSWWRMWILYYCAICGCYIMFCAICGCYIMFCAICGYYIIVQYVDVTLCSVQYVDIILLCNMWMLHYILCNMWMLHYILCNMWMLHYSLCNILPWSRRQQSHILTNRRQSRMMNTLTTFLNVLWHTSPTVQWQKKNFLTKKGK